jgi:hypothetical protein
MVDGGNARREPSAHFEHTVAQPKTDRNFTRVLCSMIPKILLHALSSVRCCKPAAPPHWPVLSCPGSQYSERNGILTCSGVIRRRSPPLSSASCRPIVSIYENQRRRAGYYLASSLVICKGNANGAAARQDVSPQRSLDSPGPEHLLATGARQRNWLSDSIFPADAEPRAKSCEERGRERTFMRAMLSLPLSIPPSRLSTVAERCIFDRLRRSAKLHAFWNPVIPVFGQP